MTMLRREFEHDGMTLSYLDSGRNKDGDGKRVDHAHVRLVEGHVRLAGSGPQGVRWLSPSKAESILTVA
jgi:hypothetical protein